MKYILFEKNNGIGILTLNKPQSLNALDTELLAEIDSCISMVEEDDEILVLIITGMGKAFVAGADISQMKDLDSVAGQKFSMDGNRIFLRIENLDIPVIAAVNGFALGGGTELALCCDIRIAAETARFGQPEVSLGITPGFGGTQRLPRVVGAAKAKEIIFGGATIKAPEALAIGLVNKVVPAEELMSSAVEMGTLFAKNAQIAVRQSKKAINKGLQCDINTGISYETQAFGLCFATEDQKTGMTAFVEKRKVESFKNK